MRNYKNRLSVSFLAVFLFLLGLVLYGCTSSNEEIRESTSSNSESEAKEAPNFSLQDQSGRMVKLSSLQGKVVVLNFWATWCLPCIKEIPGLNELYSNYRDRGVEIVGISTDETGWKAVEPFMKEHKIDYGVVVDNGKVSEKYLLRGLPLTVVIDRKGKIASRHPGYTDKSLLEEKIKCLL